jgi:hypothetical protein
MPPYVGCLSTTAWESDRLHRGGGGANCGNCVIRARAARQFLDPDPSMAHPHPTAPGSASTNRQGQHLLTPRRATVRACKSKRPVPCMGETSLPCRCVTRGSSPEYKTRACACAYPLHHGSVLAAPVRRRTLPDLLIGISPTSRHRGPSHQTRSHRSDGEAAMLQLA